MRKHRKTNNFIKSFILFVFTLIVIGLVLSVTAFFYFAKDIPDPNTIVSRKISESSKIFDRTGQTILYDIYGEERRTIIPWEEIPETIKKMTLASEDSGFYDHEGLSLRGITRALLKNVTEFKSQGGSTITQQLIKNALLGREKTFARKIREIMLSLEVERRFSKDQIFWMYLNQIPYGSNAYGIEAASQTYFGKQTKDLSYAQAALLASLPKAPSYYSPYGNNVSELTVRKNNVLDRARELNFITEEDHQKAKNEKKKIKELLERGIENIFPSKEALEQRLKSGHKISVYLGIDPTSPDLHLGHLTNFLILKRFINLGHEIFLLIGDFTAQIGDPTGKDTTRTPLTKKQVLENAKTYKNQIGKVLDLRKIKFIFNSKWLEKMSFMDVVKLTSHFTVQQMIAREMFQKRLSQSQPVGLHEFLYPLMQGYDSVALKIDAEIGGNDQTFNMLIGRDLEKEYLNKEKFVIATKLLINPVTGKKLMSKSEGGYISLEGSPGDLFGKSMTLPDEVIFDCLEFCTEIPLGKIAELRKDILDNKLNPRDVKELFAFELVKILYDQSTAFKTKEEFDRVFKQKQLPEGGPVFKLKGPESIINILTKTNLAPSSSEAKRLIRQKAVDFNNRTIESWDETIDEAGVLKVGTHRFVRIEK